jgi:cell division protein FtsB
MDSEDANARIEMLEAALQEEEAKLMQAAMFGKTLLTKNQELDLLVSQLREENQQILQRAEAEKRELQTLNDRVSAQLKEARQSNDLLTTVCAFCLTDHR